MFARLRPGLLPRGIITRGCLVAWLAAGLSLLAGLLATVTLLAAVGLLATRLLPVARLASRLLATLALLTTLLLARFLTTCLLTALALLLATLLLATALLATRLLATRLSSLCPSLAATRLTTGATASRLADPWLRPTVACRTALFPTVAISAGLLVLRLPILRLAVLWLAVLWLAVFRLPLLLLAIFLLAILRLTALPLPVLGLGLVLRLLPVVLLLLSAVLQDSFHRLTVVGAIGGNGISRRLLLLAATVLLPRSLLPARLLAC